MLLSQFVTKFITDYTLLQKSDGSFPEGHNGPYKDPETSVRNTSHVLIAMINLLQESHSEVLYEAALKSYNYLLNTENYIEKGYYLCRHGSKDSTNGLIGQAWVLEALIPAGQYFEDKKGIERAHSLYINHSFNKKLGLWHRVNKNGRRGRIDQTFNHQLWFAANSSLLLKDSPTVLGNDILIFMDKLKRNFQIFDDGLIWHSIPYKADLRSRISDNKRKLQSLIKSLIGEYDREFEGIQKIKNFYLKSVGYHSFNVFAFLKLQKNTPDHPFWESEKFRKLLDYTKTKMYLNLLDAEFYYGYPYNPPGFELPFIYYEGNWGKFGKKRANELSSTVIQKQLNYTFSNEDFSFTNNNPDVNTLNSRIYELTFLPIKYLKEIEINIEE